MNETHNTADPSRAPDDRDELRRELATMEARCTARSSRTGERCKRPAMLGGNVCYHHGGNAPQVKAKAQRRLQQAADALVQRLLGMALDGDTPDHVALQAIRDALDRAGLGAKQAVEVGVELKPWETMMMDFANISRERQAALERGEIPPAPGSAQPVIDAEVVDGPERDGERAEDAGQPANPAQPSAPPSRTLEPEEQALAEAAQANRRAGVSHSRRKRR